MKHVTYSAPAKVILSGEHAVVYGKPALVSAIDLLLKFSITTYARSSKDSNNARDVLLISQKVKEFLQKQKINYTDKKFDYAIQSDIPIGRGLGSSAAFSVAAVAAFLEFYTGKEFEKEIINNLAYEIEKRFHKNPSGIDNTASCFGGLIYYRKEFEFLKAISALNIRIPKKIEANLYLIDTGKAKESTAFMVHNVVGSLYNRKPRLAEEILNDIEKVVKRIVVFIIKEDIEFFLKSIVDNQVLLEVLGVVSKRTKVLLKELEPYGVGKITGAGGKEDGSGYILFYSINNRKFEMFCKKEKISYFKFRQSNDGVKKE